MLVKKGDWVILTKLSDDYFDGMHPNGIYAGYYQVGELLENITIGERALVQGKRMDDRLHTSKVVDIIDDTTFKTTYSTYKIELYENN